jgi:hypothetical protein
MHGLRSWIFRIAAAVAIVVSFSIGAVQAQSLDAVRASGAVGEQFDGYAVVRDAGAGADVKALVDTVNAKRRDIYNKRAAEQGVAVGQVGRVYAQQIMQKAAAGTWFRDESGNWKQK